MVLKAVFIAGGYLVLLMVRLLYRERPLLPGRVLPAAADLDPRFADHGVVAGSDHGLRGARAGDRAVVPAGRLAQGRCPFQRGVPEVLHPSGCSRPPSCSTACRSVRADRIGDLRGDPHRRGGPVGQRRLPPGRPLHPDRIRVQESRRCPSISGPPTPTRAPPLPVTAYLSVGSKAAGFVGLLLLCYRAFPSVTEIWGPALVGAGGAFDDPRQPDRAAPGTTSCRMLAYSSIAQGGFILVPFAAAAVTTIHW